MIRDDRILSVGSPAPVGTSTIECSGCLIIPGNACAHHHLYSALARGMPYTLDPPENFAQILQRVWWRLDRALDEPAVWLSGWAGGADALLAGTTTIVDHHASPNAIPGSLDALAAALGSLGVRSVLCYEVTDRDGQERAVAGVEENRRFLKAAGGARLARGMVGAHASFTLSPETLAACVDLARQFATGIHLHVAEDEADQRDALARFGQRVVDRLLEAGALDGPSLLAHAIHLDEGELKVLTESPATVVHNPRSNMNNGVGHAPVSAFGRLALGTDGIGGDMFAESQAGFWRARESDLSVGPQWAVDRLAESARFVGSIFGEPLLGSLEPGAPADLVVLRYAPPTPLTEENVAGHWIFGLSARMVRDVVVGGAEVVRDGRLVQPDVAELRARSVQAAEGLWRRMEELEAHPFEPAG